MVIIEHAVPALLTTITIGNTNIVDYHYHSSYMYLYCNLPGLSASDAIR